MSEIQITTNLDCCEKNQMYQFQQMWIICFIVQSFSKPGKIHLKGLLQ